MKFGGVGFGEMIGGKWLGWTKTNTAKILNKKFGGVGFGKMKRGIVYPTGWTWQTQAQPKVFKYSLAGLGLVTEAEIVTLKHFLVSGLRKPLYFLMIARAKGTKLVFHFRSNQFPTSHFSESKD